MRQRFLVNTREHLIGAPNYAYRAYGSPALTEYVLIVLPRSSCDLTKHIGARRRVGFSRAPYWGTDFGRDRGKYDMVQRSGVVCAQAHAHENLEYYARVALDGGLAGNSTTHGQYATSVWATMFRETWEESRARTKGSSRGVRGKAKKAAGPSA